MSNKFSGKTPEEGVTPSSSIRKPGLIIGAILSLLILGAFGLVWFAFYYHPKAGSETPPGSAVIGSQAPQSHTYTKVYEVGYEPVRVETPFGYKASYRWGYAPVETRTSADPSWIDVDKMPDHIEGGQKIRWREWRVSPKYEEGIAKVTYTFTKAF